MTGEDGMAKGYIMVEVTIPDIEAYRASGYMAMAEKAIAAHGGRFLVRGGDPLLLEGTQAPGRIVILEFPTREQASAFFHSDSYAPALSLRNTLSVARGMLLSGHEP